MCLWAGGMVSMEDRYGTYDITKSFAADISWHCSSLSLLCNYNNALVA